LLLGSGILLLGLWQVPLFAQEEQAAPPAGKIYVEQRSNIDALGVWTVLQPNHESFHRSDKSLEIPNLTPGQYSIFVNAPMGTATKIDVHLGDEVTVSSDTPQITFTLRDKETRAISRKGYQIQRRGHPKKARQESRIIIDHHDYYPKKTSSIRQKEGSHPSQDLWHSRATTLVYFQVPQIHLRSDCR
jgi:hypothetical protein